MKHDPDPFQRIYRLKLVIVGLALAFLGVLTSLVADYLASSASANHLVVAITRALSDVLLITGAIGIAVEFVTGRAKQRADQETQRAMYYEMLPNVVDTVLRAFAASPKQLERVATSELLDSIAANALGLRLGDAGFAREIYEDIRDQAVRAPERWHDVDVSIRLSSIDERSTSGAPRFDVTVTWSYTVTPSHATQRFACVSDKDEFHDLISDIPSTATWFMTPRPGFDASQRDAFELVDYTVNGERRTIRRSTRKTGQTYSVNIGEDLVREGEPVQITYVYRTITPQNGHLLYFDIEQPTKNIKVQFDYSAADIAHVSVLDLIASSKRSRVLRLPDNVPGKSITVDFDGWVFPRTGFAFVWTLGSEVHSEDAAAAAAAAADIDQLAT